MSDHGFIQGLFKKYVDG